MCSRRLHKKTTTEILDGRNRPNPLTWKCTNMYSERSEELKARQEGENDPADMWYMPKK